VRDDERRDAETPRKKNAEEESETSNYSLFSYLGALAFIIFQIS
jgi:hypothetical protein